MKATGLRARRRSYLSLLLVAALIGALAAVGTVVFRYLIFFFQELFWPKGETFLARVQAAPWWYKLLVPTIAGLVVGPVGAFWAPEIRGPGVSEVIAAVVRHLSFIHHRVTFLKTLVTSFLLGAGASVGREGPVVHIGASIGSSLGHLWKLPLEFRKVALACGAAAGIAATFNAPVAGTLFALEVILFDLEVSHLAHIVVAAVVASVVAHHFWGPLPTLAGVHFQDESHLFLALYLLIGLVTGLMAIVFIRLMSFLEDVLVRFKLPLWSMPAVGGILLGALALKFPQVMGVGYETINAALEGMLLPSQAISLAFLKLLATCLCLGAGMSGGILAPSLVIGACLGVGLGSSLGQLFSLPVSPVNCALVGMGAMVAGGTLAPITAIITVFELTYDHNVILPLMVACVASVVIVRGLFGYSVYEMKLLRQGHRLLRGHDLNILRCLPVKDYMIPPLETVRVDTPLGELIRRAIESPYPHFVVLDRMGLLSGVLSLRDLRPALPLQRDLEPLILAYDLMTREVITISEKGDLGEALEIFQQHPVSFLPVVGEDNPRRVLGILRREDVLSAYHQKILKERVLSCPL